MMNQKHSVFLVSSRNSFINEVDRAAASLGGVAIAGRVELSNGSTAPAGVKAARAGAASIILIDLDSDPVEALRALAEIAEQAPEISIVAASASRDPELILQTMRSGAADLLSLPLASDKLGDALVRATRRHGTESTAAGARGRVISFMSVKGGCGATTVAVNLGVAMCAGSESGRRPSVILLDLDAPLGDATAMLKLEPSYTLADVAANIRRLDMDLLASMATRHASGLMVLAAAPEPERQVGPDAMGAIVGFLRDHFDTVILAGGGLSETEMAAVNQAHTVHLVTTLDFLALRRGQELMARLTAFGATGDSLRVVVNKHDRGSDLTLADAAEALGAPVAWTVPGDARTAERAINEGTPFVSRGKSKLASAFTDYAAQLAKGDAGQDDRQGFGSLLKRLVPGRAGATS